MSNKLKQLYKGSKPSKIIKVFGKGDVWDECIYVRPYPRSKLKQWFAELEDSEKNQGSGVVSRFFELMAMFVGECLCDEHGEYIADGSQETVDFLMSIDDEQVLLDLYREASRASGLITVANGLLDIVNSIDNALATAEAEATKQTAKKKRSRRSN